MAQLPPVGGTIQLAGVPQFTAAVQTVNAGFASVGAAASRLGSQVGGSAQQLGRSFQDIGRGAGGAATGVGQFVASLNPLSSRLASSVISVTTFVVALQAAHAALGAISAAVKEFGGGAAIDFQAQFKGVEVFAKTDTLAQLGELRKEVLDLGRELPVAFDKINEAAAELGKAGQTGAQLLAGSLRAAVTLIAASQNQLSGETSAGLINTALNAFKLGADKAQEVADTIASVVVSSQLNFQGFADSFSALGTVGADLNFTLADTAIAIAIVADAGIKGSTAGTALRSAFQQLLDPSKQGLEVMKQYGISLTTASGGMVTFEQFLGQLTNAFGKNAEGVQKTTDAERAFALATLFDSRAITAVNALIAGGTEAYAKYRGEVEKLTASGIAKQFAEPVEQQFELIRQNVQAAAIAVGSIFLPIFEQSTARITAALQAIDLEPLFAIGEAVRLVITGQADLSVLVGLLEQIGGLDLAQGFAGLATTFESIKGSAGLVGEAIGRVVEQLVRITTEGVGAGQLVNILQNVAGAAAFAATLIAGIVDVGADLLKTITSNSIAADVLRNTLLGLVAAPVVILTGAFLSLLGAILPILAPLFTVGLALGLIITGVQNAGNAMAGLSETFGETATGGERFASAQGRVETALNTLRGELEGTNQTLEDLRGRLVEAESAVGDAGDGAEDSAEQIGTLQDAIAEAEEKAAGLTSQITLLETPITKMGAAGEQTADQLGDAAESFGDLGEAAADAGEAADEAATAQSVATAEIIDDLASQGQAAFETAGAFNSAGEQIGGAADDASTAVGTGADEIVTNLEQVARATTPVGQAFIDMANTVKRAFDFIFFEIRGTLLNIRGAFTVLSGGNEDLLGDIFPVVKRGLDVIDASLEGINRAVGVGDQLEHFLRGGADAANEFGATFAEIKGGITRASEAATAAQQNFSARFSQIQRDAASAQETIDGIRRKAQENADAARRNPPKPAELSFPPGKEDKDKDPKGRSPFENAVLEAQRLGRELSDALEKLDRETGQKLAEITRKAVEKVQEILAKAVEDTKEAQKKFVDAITDLNEQRDLQRDIQLQRDALRQRLQNFREHLSDQRELEDEERAARFKADDQDAKDRLDVLRDRLRDEHELKLDAFRRDQEDAERAIQRAEDDEERRLRRAEEARKKLSGQGTPVGGFTITGNSSAQDDREEERRIVRQRAREDTALARRRGEEEKFRQFRESQEALLNKNIAQLDNAELARQEIQEAETRQTRLTRRTEDRKNAATEDGLQRELEDSLDEQDHRRKLLRISAELAARLTAINTETAARVAAVRDDTIVDVGKVVSGFDDNVADIFNRFDRAAESLRERVGDGIDPILEELRGSLLGSTSAIQTGVANNAEAVVASLEGLPDTAEGVEAEVNRRLEGIATGAKTSLLTIETNTISTFGRMTGAIVGGGLQIQNAMTSAGQAIAELGRQGANLRLPQTNQSTNQQPGGSQAALIAASTGVPLSGLPFAGSFTEGGIVGGRGAAGAFGREVLAKLHVGEIVVGQSESRALLTAVAALETMSLKMPRGGALTPQTVNQNYTFNANYAQQQSPVTLEMDIRAIMAMTQR